MPKIKLVLWWILAAAYIAVRFAKPEWMEAPGPYAPYIVEALLVSLAIVLDGRAFIEKLKAPLSAPRWAFAVFPLGFIAYRLCGSMGWPIPFEFHGFEILFFLLIVAPLLEEALFRFFLWEPVARVNAAAALIVTSVLFSYAHYHSIAFMPLDYHPFIYVQTAYTFLLALGCGAMVLKHRSLSGSVLMHFMFNLGFYAGSLI